MLPAAVIEELCVVATYERLASVLADRYGSLCAGVLLRPPEARDGSVTDDVFAEVVAAVRAATPR